MRFISPIRRFFQCFLLGCFESLLLCNTTAINRLAQTECFSINPRKQPCPGHFLARRYHECLRCNSGDFGMWGSFRILLLTFPRRWLNSRMALNIGPTKHVARRVGLPRTEIIYHGVPFPFEMWNDAGANSSSSPICFAYVGRMVQEKGIPVSTPSSTSACYSRL